MFNYRMIFRFLGILLLLNGSLMVLCVPFALVYNENLEYIILSAMATISTGGFFWVNNQRITNKQLTKKDGYLIVTLGWLFMSLFGSLPYILSGFIPNLTDAFFETISGFTTTGASILNNIEEAPKSLLFWRSLTQWIGGMGIIVLAVAILPILGIGGMQLFVAEAPGISPDKMQPRIRETAKRLYFIYFMLTLAETLLLWLFGMSFYDAINHALTTMATGGFSTRQDSIAYYTSPAIQYVIIVFMFFAGTNFTLTYFTLKGKLKNVWSNEEFRGYVSIIILVAVSSTIVVYLVSDEGFEKSFRDSLFQVISVLTTTGYVTADYTSWAPLLTVIFFLLMFLGGSAGSTAGGVKIVRHIVLFKNSILELKRQLHPSAVIPVRLNGTAVPRDITFNTLAFIMIYFSVFAFGSIAMALLGLDFETAIGAVATSLGNIGPGIGEVGPIDNFANIPATGKWVLSFLMLTGRLELFTVLMLFTPYFWKNV
ncbi:MAG: potassium transporter TrkG [Bacteroidota bacterium]